MRILKLPDGATLDPSVYLLNVLYPTVEGAIAALDARSLINEKL